MTMGWHLHARRRAFLLGTLSAGVWLAQAAAAETPSERGGYLVNGILACGNCHTPKDAGGAPIADKNLSGGLSFTTPAFNATAANITPDPETGIGKWSADDIKQALAHGSRPSHVKLAGAPLAAVMPAGFYKALLPADLDAIAAYLKTLPAVRNEVAAPTYKLPVRHARYPDAEAGFSEDALRDPVRRGAYLVTIGHCMECHSPFDRSGPDYADGLGKGGRTFNAALVQGFSPDWPGSTAPNITSHPRAGIGGWSDAEIKRAITQGISRDGHKLKPPMAFAWYATMSDADLSAIVAYLRTVPARE